MNEDEWLQGLKPGDEVIVSNRWGKRIEKVERTTPTQIILPRNTRYHKSNGREMASRSWDKTRLQQPTPEDVTKIRQEQARQMALTRLANFRFSALTTAALEQICAILDNPASKEMGE
jgi:hypothetical protein